MCFAVLRSKAMKEAAVPSHGTTLTIVPLSLMGNPSASTFAALMAYGIPCGLKGGSEAKGPINDGDVVVNRPLMHQFSW